MNSKINLALKWIIEILNSYQIPYVITGGLAAHYYGATREINDIDIDVPDDMLELLFDNVKQYATTPLMHSKDTKWDLKLMTLNYENQEIDIGGANSIKIFNEKTGEWENFPSEVFKAVKGEIFGIPVSIQNPEDLIKYKRVLISSFIPSNHHIHDIDAITKYIKNKNTF